MGFYHGRNAAPVSLPAPIVPILIPGTFLLLVSCSVPTGLSAFPLLLQSTLRKVVICKGWVRWDCVVLSCKLDCVNSLV